MTISYPLTFPSGIVSSVKWIQEQSVNVNESPFSFKRQVQIFSGERWKLQFSIDELDRDEAATMTAFLTALRGPIGSFKFGDELYNTPRGAGGGTPKVKGAAQSGYTLLTDGWPISTTVLKKGDFFQIAGTYDIHTVLNDALTNGSGEVTLDIWPRAKAPNDNADLTLNNWFGLFALEDEESEILSPRYDHFQTFGFTAVEVR